MAITKIHPGAAERPRPGSGTRGPVDSRRTASAKCFHSRANHQRQMKKTTARTATAIGVAQRKKSITVRCALSAMVMPTGPNAAAAEPVLVANTNIIRNGIGLV